MTEEKNNLHISCISKLKTFLTQPVVRSVILIFSLYFFILSIGLIGSGFKLMGKGFSEFLITTISDPITGVFIGLLATTIVQSSSCTTSVIVALCATGMMPIETAIPAVMGANIGTTVTNTIVSFGHITRKTEFKYAISGATVHDFFNILAVIILLPIEIIFHPLKFCATGMSAAFEEVGGLKAVSPLKLITHPVTGYLKENLSVYFSDHQMSIIFIILGLFILFISLKVIVSSTRILVIGKAERLIKNYLFGTAIASFLLGLALTSIVQSSSVTTSLIIPLVGAGILTVEKIFPYTLGANIGTTVTAILASLATGNPAGITIAFVHLLFNVFGIGIIYPIRKIPITLAKKFGELASERKTVAIVYIVVTFYIIPVIYILITRVIK